MQKDGFLKISPELLDPAMPEATYVRILKFCATCSVMSDSLQSQAPLSMGFPDLGVKPASPVSPALQADSLPLSHGRSTWFVADAP